MSIDFLKKKKKNVNTYLLILNLIVNSFLVFLITK